MVKKKKGTSKKKKGKEGRSLKELNVKHTSFWLPCLLFLGLAFGLYFQSLNYDFILDDKIVITHNDFTKKGLEGIPDHLSSEVFTGYFGEKKDLLVGGRYRPLSLIVFSVIYEFWELDPLPYHVVNILFYGGVCFLMFALLRIFLPSRYQKDPWYLAVPMIAAMFYLFHPIHIEAVANIKGLDEILTLFFSLLTWLVAVKVYKQKSLIWPVVMGLSFFVALLAKENALTFLAVIPLSFYVFAKPSRSDYLKMLVPMIIASVIYLYIRYQILGYFLSPGKEVTDIMNNPFYGLNAMERFSTVMFTWLKYIVLLIFPHPLVHDYYPYAIPIMDLGDWEVWLSILINGALILVALIGIIRKKTAPFWLLFYFITFSIVSNLLFTVGTFMNDRFIFIPSMGFAVLMALFIGYYLKKWLPGKKIAFWGPAFLIVAILSAYTAKTLDRIPDWETHLSLNKSAVDEYPTSARSTLFYGTALYNEALEINNREKQLEKLREAEKWIDRSISVFPERGNRRTRNYKYFNSYKMKAGVAAEIYKLTGDLDYLLGQFLFVAKEKPELNFLRDYLRYIHSKVSDKEKLITFYHELAFEELARKKRNYNYAMAYINLGLEFAPDSAILNYDKGRILRALGRTAEAQQFINKAQQLDPSVIKQ